MERITYETRIVKFKDVRIGPDDSAPISRTDQAPTSVGPGIYGWARSITLNQLMFTISDFDYAAAGSAG